MTSPNGKAQMNEAFGTDDYEARPGEHTKDAEKDWSEYTDDNGFGSPLDRYDAWMGVYDEDYLIELGANGYPWNVDEYSSKEAAADDDDDNFTNHASGTSSSTPLSAAHYTDLSSNSQSDDDTQAGAHPFPEVMSTGTIDPRMLLPTTWVRTPHGQRRERKAIEARKKKEQAVTANATKKSLNMTTKKAQPQRGAPKKRAGGTAKTTSKRSLAGAGARVKAQLTAAPARTHTGTRMKGRPSANFPPKSTTTTRPSKSAGPSPRPTRSANASASTNAALNAPHAHGPVRRSTRGKTPIAITSAVSPEPYLGQDREAREVLAEPPASISPTQDDEEAMEVEPDFVQTQAVPSVDTPSPESEVNISAPTTAHADIADEEPVQMQGHQSDEPLEANALDHVREEVEGVVATNYSNPVPASTSVTELGVGGGPPIHPQILVHGASVPAIPDPARYTPHAFPPVPPPPQWNVQQPAIGPYHYPYQHPPMGPPLAHPGYTQPPFGYGYPQPPHPFGYSPVPHGYPHPQNAPAPYFPGFVPVPHPHFGYVGGYTQPAHLPPYAGPAPPHVSAHQTSNRNAQHTAPPPPPSPPIPQPFVPQGAQGGSQIIVWQATTTKKAIPEVVLPSRVPATDEELIWCGHIAAKKQWDREACDWRNPRCNYLILKTEEAIQNHYLHIHRLNWTESFESCRWGSSCTPRMKGDKVPKHIHDVHVNGGKRMCEGKGCKLAELGAPSGARRSGAGMSSPSGRTGRAGRISSECGTPGDEEK